MAETQQRAGSCEHCGSDGWKIADNAIVRCDACCLFDSDIQAALCVSAATELRTACKDLMRRFEVNELIGKHDSLGRADQAAYDTGAAAITKAEVR